MSKYRIAIDGPSGSGKSTISKLIAKKYNLKYINTGLVYRSIVWYLIKENININDEKSVLEQLKNIKIKLLKNEIVNINSQKLSKELRTNKISQFSSIVASYKKVREYALKIQRQESSIKGIIMDGRDTTFKIMPDADIKIFLDTSSEVRAKRRMIQNNELGYNSNYDKILKEIEERDHRDRTRKIDPLHQTKDSHLIDASNMTIQEVVESISIIIQRS